LLQFSVDDEIDNLLVEGDERTTAHGGSQQCYVSAFHKRSFEFIKIFPGKTEPPACFGNGHGATPSGAEHFISNLRQIQRVEEVEALEQGTRDTLRLGIQETFLFEKAYFDLGHKYTPVFWFQ
jgi:hypothetical protein